MSAPRLREEPVTSAVRPPRLADARFVLMLELLMRSLTTLGVRSDVEVGPAGHDATVFDHDDACHRARVLVATGQP